MIIITKMNLIKDSMSKSNNHLKQIKTVIMRTCNHMKARAKKLDSIRRERIS